MNKINKMYATIVVSAVLFVGACFFQSVMAQRGIEPLPTFAPPTPSVSVCAADEVPFAGLSIAVNTYISNGCRDINIHEIGTNGTYAIYGLQRND